MKRFLLSLILFAPSLSLMANLNGDGYYRVKNVVTERYISVVDNRGSIDIASTTADFGAIRTIRYFENVVSDPSTIIYFKKVSSGYNLTSQGTSTRQIIGYYMKLEDLGDGTYKAYGESHGMRAYLGDANVRDTIATVVSNNSKTTLWYIIPVDQGEESFFGVQPEFTSKGSYWASMYASFPYSPVSPEMKTYTITNVDSKYGVAIWKEITTTDIPAATPVIIQCPSASPSGNMLDIHTSSVKTPKDNLLKGVYFCNTTLAHRNVVENDTSTMRVLGTSKDGSLCFVRSSEQFMPANKAYLQVPAGSPAELKIMDATAYETYVVQQKEKEDSIQHVQDSIHHVHDSIASVVADGYYRIRCVETGRYMTLRDNKGSVDALSGSADLAAFRTVNDFSNIISDPSSVFFIHRSDDGYTLRSQDTDTREMFGEPILFHCDTLTSNWTMWGLSDGWKWTFSDSSDSGNEGFVCTDTNRVSTWKLIPVTITAGQEIAVSPTIQVERNYYQTYLASYSSTLASKSSQSYYVELVSTSYGAVVWQPCDNRELPEATPLIVRSAYSSPASNRLTLTSSALPSPQNNQLKGVWYNNSEEGHINRIANDTATIRVLGKGSDGKLSFVVSDADFLPANSAFISVPAGSPAELKVMEPAEFEAWVAYTDSVNSVVPFSTITYYVDGVVFRVDSLAHGVAIPSISEPVKEGYTFSGWTDLPSSMPSYDVIVYGTFAVNSYHLTYLLDGEIFSEADVDFGTALTPLEAPEREGHTFSGWGEVPAQMPAHDVVVSGTFTVNNYLLTYYLDGEQYKQEEIAYGAILVAESAPEREGYIFSGWGELPETMPAHDLDVHGSFTVNDVSSVLIGGRKVNVYNMLGQMVRYSVDEIRALENLPAGVYVVGGRKYVVSPRE